MAFGIEDRIIAETLVTLALTANFAAAHALKLITVTIHQQDNHSTELRLSLLDIGHIMEQFVHISLTIVRETTIIGITSRTDTRFHTQGTYLESAVIRETIQIVMDLDILRFLQSIVSKGHTILRDVDVTSYIFQ